MSSFRTSVRAQAGRRQLLDRILTLPLFTERIRSKSHWVAQVRTLRIRQWVWLAVLVLAGLAGVEARTSWVQARLLAGAARRITYAVEPGPSPSIRFPATGPYDRRLGYSLEPRFLQKLMNTGFKVETQARWSEAATWLFDRGMFPIYFGKDQAGLHPRRCGALLMPGLGRRRA